MGGSRDGFQIDIGGGERLTVNSADDPRAAGGWYQTTTDSSGNKSTAVYGADGSMPSGLGDNDSYK
jgi:hypothetical protein